MKRRRNYHYMFNNKWEAFKAFLGLAAAIAFLAFAGALGVFLILAIAVLAIFEKHAGLIILACALLFIAYQLQLF